jgi:hypothetical protein
MTRSYRPGFFSPTSESGSTTTIGTFVPGRVWHTFRRGYPVGLSGLVYAAVANISKEVKFCVGFLLKGVINDGRSNRTIRLERRKEIG